MVLGLDHGLKRKPESPEALQGEDWRAMASLPFPGSARLSRDPCWENPGINGATSMERAPPTDRRIPKVFRDSLGEVEGMRDTTDRDDHRIPAT